MKLFPPSHAGIAPALSIVAALLICFIPLPVAANPPSSVMLSYDQLSSVLSVTIDHPLQGIPNHYIREVKLKVNDAVVNDSLYTGQESDIVTYTYPLVLRPGDIVGANAVCSLAGSKSGDFIMPGSTVAAPPGMDQPSPPQTQKASASMFTILAGTGILLVIRRRG